MLKLNAIKAQPGSVTSRKRLGRGAGSGLGQTAGKGDKGQLARTGGHVRPGFEGGQMPMYRRIPKRGFTNPTTRSQAIFNLFQLEKLNPSEFKEVTLESLVSTNTIKGRYDRLTILGTGELTKKFSVKAHRISASAQEKIKKAGGSFELLAIPGPQPRKKKEAPAKSAK